jgi:regulator of protease activity HflC (stomatin/prohibitin superfamily)
MDIAALLKDRDFQALPGVSEVGVFLFVVFLAAGVGLAAITQQPYYLAAGALLGVYLLFAIRVAKQWEKAAIFRLGRYRGLRGPGVFVIVPILDSVSRMVDQRVRVADVSAESALTRDTVPVNVDAIIFWVVWNAEKCILEVEDFYDAIRRSAQTALRESIGRHELAEKGSMVVVPSTAVETMGLGGMMGTVALAKPLS